jgi:hypothetical protein
LDYCCSISLSKVYQYRTKNCIPICIIFIWDATTCEHVKSSLYLNVWSGKDWSFESEDQIKNQQKIYKFWVKNGLHFLLLPMRNIINLRQIVHFNSQIIIFVNFRVFLVLRNKICFNLKLPLTIAQKLLPRVGNYSWQIFKTVSIESLGLYQIISKLTWLNHRHCKHTLQLYGTIVALFHNKIGTI